MTLGFGLGFPRRPHALRPALSLNFLGVSYLDPQVTFSRASNATQFDSLGRLVWAPHNLFRSTQNIALSPWTAIGTVPPILTDGQPDPFGGNGATLVDLNPATDCRVAQTALTVASVPDNSDVTVSFWLRRAPGETLTTHVAQYRQKTGTATLVNLAVSDEWQRVSFTFNADAGSLPVLIWLNIQSGPTIKKYIVYGPQLNLGNILLPFNQNTSAVAEYFGPRFDYNPATLAPRGLLFEAQRVNLQPTYQGVAADWSGTFGTISSTGAIILGNPALTFTVNSTAGAQFAFITAAPAALAASTVHTSSVRVKRGNHPRVQFTCTVNAFQPTVADAYLNYNFDTDTLVVAGSALPAPTGTRFVCADGSVILTLTFTSGTAPTAGAAGIIALVDSDAAVRFAGTATNGATVHVFGMQIEAGAFATSLIPTFGTAATRAGDVADLVSAPPYSSAGMTYYTEFERQGIALPSTPDAGAALFYWGDAVDWVSATFGFGIPAQQRMDNGSGGASQLQVSQSNGVPFTIYKCASRLALNDGQMAQNGALGAPDLIGTLAATLGTARYSIGRSNAATSNQFHGWLRKINVTTQPLPDATLVSLTA